MEWLSGAGSSGAWIVPERGRTGRSREVDHQVGESHTLARMLAVRRDLIGQRVTAGRTEGHRLTELGAFPGGTPGPDDEEWQRAGGG